MCTIVIRGINRDARKQNNRCVQLLLGYLTGWINPIWDAQNYKVNFVVHQKLGLKIQLFCYTKFYQWLNIVATIYSSHVTGGTICANFSRALLLQNVYIAQNDRRMASVCFEFMAISASLTISYSYL